MDTKKRFKMYKAGKKWCYAAVATISVAFGMAISTNAQADVNKQTTAAKKKSVAANYEKQIQSKREANAKEYTTKLKAADANITAIIRQKATAMGYTMVIPKASVICGGDDITASILPLIK